MATRDEIERAVHDALVSSHGQQVFLRRWREQYAKVAACTVTTEPSYEQDTVVHEPVTIVVPCQDCGWDVLVHDHFIARPGMVWRCGYCRELEDLAIDARAKEQDGAALAAWRRTPSRTTALIVYLVVVWIGLIVVMLAID